MRYLIITIAAVVVAIVLTIFLTPRVRNFIARFRLQAPLIKKYWLIVIIYILIVTIAYWIIWRYFYSSTNLNVLGQLVAILFAIFVGYIAFNEFSDKRYESNYQIGMSALRDNRYKEALIYLENCRSIKPKDKNLLLNLLELYALLGEEKKFDNNIEVCKKSIVEDEDLLSWYYLKATRHLLREHIQETREVIAELVEFVLSKPGVRARYSWSYKELKESERYKSLGSTSKKIFKNYTDYLHDKLTDEEENKLESGDLEFSR